MVVEVFRTNVKDADDAHALVRQIHATFSGYIANFDLDDCDRILRVASRGDSVRVADVIKLLDEAGYEARVLSDDIPEIMQFEF